MTNDPRRELIARAVVDTLPLPLLRRLFGPVEVVQQERPSPPAASPVDREEKTTGESQ
jgi:hypothetical protein